MARRARLLACASALLAALLLTGSAGAERFERHATPEPGDVVHIWLERGDVVVTSHSEPSLRVEVETRGIGAGGVDVEFAREAGSTVVVRQRLAEWIQHMRVGPGVVTRIALPDRSSATLHLGEGRVSLESLWADVSVHVARGDATAASGRGGLAVVAARGAIRVADWTGALELRARDRIAVARVRGDVDAETDGGPVAATGIEGSFRAHTHGGALDVDGLFGTVAAETRGGPAVVRFAGPPRGSVDAAEGGISLVLPALASTRLDAHTPGGRVHLAPDLAWVGSLEPTRVRARLRRGGQDLTLRARDADIRLAADRLGP
ncbi:MAG: hypothetical protein MJE66_15840 [Proteobacteria bacterium]|nr:hypothetical protein [Pseudomonadota bacterium]